MKSSYLFDLILYVQDNIFSVMSGLVFLGLTSTKQQHSDVPPGDSYLLHLNPKSSTLPISPCAPHGIEIISLSSLENRFLRIKILIVFCVDSLRRSQQLFSHVGIGLLD